MAKINNEGEFTCDGCGAKAKAYLCGHWVHDDGKLLCGKCQKKKRKAKVVYERNEMRGIMYCSSLVIRLSVFFITLFTLTNCNLNRVYMTMFERQMLWQLEHARYVQYGNNCFMVVDGYHSVNFVYMPCDSIKGQFIPTIKPRRK